MNNLKLPLQVNTYEDDIYADVIQPLLRTSIKYRRGVAYFNSDWVDLCGNALVDFINAGGTIDLITSIHLDEDDFEAFKMGEKAKCDEYIKKEIMANLNESHSNRSKYYLAWLVANHKLSLKIVVSSKRGLNIYHDKISLFYGEKMKVCLHGSLNDTYNATRNYESINIFNSKDVRDAERIKEQERLFEIAWNDELKGDFFTIELPDVVLTDFAELSQKYVELAKKTKVKEGVIEERPYQTAALESIRNHNYRGILEMATGTGKTYTSLFIAQEYHQKYNSNMFFVIVPQIHLAAQWVVEIKKLFSNAFVMNCTGLKKDWYSDFLYYTSQKSEKTHFFVTTYRTFIAGSFQQGYDNSQEAMMFIFDECHSLGTEQAIENVTIPEHAASIGLSATPNRLLDPIGNNFIKSIIGPTVFTFDIEQAIEKKMLVPYSYHPKLVEITFEEHREYMKYTRAIARIINSEDPDQEELQKLYILRSQILKSAEKKKICFYRDFSESQEKSYTLVYVNDKETQIVAEEIRKRFQLNVHEIVAETPAEERVEILNSFNAGDIDVIVAIKCLDEGIDVPNAKRAYILASSSNPREFIQRRGRVLRKSDGKEYAEIYDYITVAPNSNQISSSEKRLILKPELKRVHEFSKASKDRNPINITNYLIDNKIEDLFNLLQEDENYDN